MWEKKALATQFHVRLHKKCNLEAETESRRTFQSKVGLGLSEIVAESQMGEETRLQIPSTFVGESRGDWGNFMIW